MSHNDRTKHASSAGLWPAILLYALSVSPALLAASPDRIPDLIDKSRTFRIAGSVHARANSNHDRGLVEPSFPIEQMALLIKPSVAQQEAIDLLLSEQRNPSSPNYKRWLTPEQYADRFGLSQHDIARLAGWLKAQGFTVKDVALARNRITFNGNAAQVGAAFGTEIHRYEVDDEVHFANTTEYSIPEDVADVVSSVRGLHNFRLKPPAAGHEINAWSLTPDFTDSNGGHYLAPDDLAKVYNMTPLYDLGFDGTGQQLVIVGQTAIDTSDIATFRTTFNLPPLSLQVIVYGSDPGISKTDLPEAALDLEWSGSVARNASLLYVYSQHVVDAAYYAIDHNLAPVLSMSYGGCEQENSPDLRSLVQQASLQGITFIASSGDSGAAACDAAGSPKATRGLAVNLPASIPEVTAVGGTAFSSGRRYWSSSNTDAGMSVLSYIPETAWNDSSALAGIAASGGGISTYFPQPSWQAGPGVPNTGFRNVPDVSLASSPEHDGYLVYFGGNFYAYGGTSAAAPAFAGIVSLLNHYLLASGNQGQPGLGNINPALYQIAERPWKAFHDVVHGSNLVPCEHGSADCPEQGYLGYHAGKGYDLVTGLGSVDATKMITNWSTVAGAGTN
ncbi:MAG TPA: S53 family peptidase [Terriglobales bacterium]|nr:S53 family peptidase [Terriglobales bacterium]HZW92694.1 S53 family peptidase [Candidatus Eremiobacteraceae bacterium]